jgi:hypothetical protein
MIILRVAVDRSAISRLKARRAAAGGRAPGWF